MLCEIKLFILKVNKTVNKINKYYEYVFVSIFYEIFVINNLQHFFQFISWQFSTHFANYPFHPFAIFNAK